MMNLTTEKPIQSKVHWKKKRTHMRSKKRDSFNDVVGGG